MVLGGLKEGVTPLRWTYAYMTIANNGSRVSGTLAPQPGDSPVAFTEGDRQQRPHDQGRRRPTSCTRRSSPRESPSEAKSILETVVTSGTGTHANIGVPGEWGKTGTTENNGDAWFCGAITEVTACVWVGYADTTTPMATLYNGGPVMGGTFPALIWARVITAWRQIKAEMAAEKASHTERLAPRARPSRRQRPRPKPKPNHRPRRRANRPNPAPQNRSGSRRSPPNRRRRPPAEPPAPAPGRRRRRRRHAG